MDIGVSVGPYIDRIEELPASFSFVALSAVGGDRPLAAGGSDQPAG